jgi:hypothetical protein
LGSGLPVVTQTISAASVAANTTAEQQITIAPTLPTFTANINAAGQLASVTINSAGSNLVIPPTLVVQSGDPLGTVQTGGIPAVGGTQSPYGQGATCEAILQGGAVVGVIVTEPGSGYVAATPPTVTAFGGHGVETGMVVCPSFGSAYTAQAGLGIAGARVVSDGVIGLTFINTTGAAITPTASTVYNFACLHAIPPVNNKLFYGVNAGTLASVASSTTAEQTITVNGLSAADKTLVASKPALQAGLAVVNARTSAANQIALIFANVTASALTPSANEVYGVYVQKIAPTAPLAVLTSLLTPASVAANTSAEQTFTLPTGTLPFTTLGSSVVVNKPTPQPGVTLSARVSAANTLAITYMNNTASAITPTSEVYTIGSFQMVAPMAGGNVYEEVLPALQTTRNMVAELQSMLTNTGFIRGY